MEFSLGVLNIAPDVFWGMTMKEFWAAYKGYSSTKPNLKAEPEGMSRNKLEQMIQMYPDD